MNVGLHMVESKYVPQNKPHLDTPIGNFSCNDYTRKEEEVPFPIGDRRG